MAEECGLEEGAFAGAVVLGELALDGALRNVGGIVAHAASLSENRMRDLLVSEGDAEMAACVPDIAAYGAKTLREAVETLRKRKLGTAVPVKRESAPFEDVKADVPDFLEIAGQERAKRALEIAAA